MLTCQRSWTAVNPGYVYWNGEVIEHLGPAPYGQGWLDVYPTWIRDATIACTNLEKMGAEVNIQNFMNYEYWFQHAEGDRSKVKYFEYFANWRDFYLKEKEMLIAFPANLVAKNGLVCWDVFVWFAEDGKWEKFEEAQHPDAQGPYARMTDAHGYDFGAAWFGGSKYHPPYSLQGISYEQIVGCFLAFGLPETAPWKENKS